MSDKAADKLKGFLGHDLLARGLPGNLSWVEVNHVPDAVLTSIRNASARQWLSAAAILYLTYLVLLAGYRLTLHPYARYPGPKIAAVSELWLRGRWPWAVESAFNKYGEVVRVAPNEIAIFGYKAQVDVLMPGKTNDAEQFLKTEELGALAGKHKGFAADTDPKLHRPIRKALEPFFNTKAIKGWKEPLFHQHFDLFVQKIERACKNGPINVTEWVEWLSMDLAGDMAFGHNYHNLRDERANEFLKTFSSLSFWGTVNQVSVRFPVLYPFIMMALLPGLATVAPRLQRENTKYMRERIQNRHKLAHEDYMSALIRSDGDVPDLDFLVAQSMNLVIGNAEAVSNMFTSTIYLLLEHPGKLEKLQQEIRGRFASYDQITYDSVQNLAWLNAVINEALRYATNGTSGLPRISPGAVVGGYYIPKGYRVQTSFQATFHSESYFAKPRTFCPERWLPKDHPDYDRAFDNDKLSTCQPFSMGIRGCVGKKTGLVQGQLMLSKLVWALDWEFHNGDDIVWERDARRYAMNQMPTVVARFTKRAGLE